MISVSPELAVAALAVAFALGAGTVVWIVTRPLAAPGGGWGWW